MKKKRQGSGVVTKNNLLGKLLKEHAYASPAAVMRLPDDASIEVQRQFVLLLRSGKLVEALGFLKSQLVEFDHPRLHESFYELLKEFHAHRMFADLKMAAEWLTVARPNLGLAWNYLGVALIELGQLQQALTVMARAAELCANNPHVMSNYANVLISTDQPDKALEVVLLALSLSPNIPELLNNAANAYRYSGNNEKAIEYYLRALETGGENPQILSNIGASLFEFGRFREAIEYYERALKLSSDYPLIYANLAWALAQSGEHEKAREYCERALQRFPDSQDIWFAYGYNLQVTNQINAAIDAFIKALAFKSSRQVSMEQKIYSHLLFCLNYHSEIGAEDIFGAYREYNLNHGLPWQAHWRPHQNERSIDRQLLIGVVAHSFHSHPCARFMLPLYENLDRQRFKIVSFATVGKVDEITERFRDLSDEWFDCRGMNDDRFADLVRELKIDILIDIDGHTAGNRLPVFARKPAPISLHWLDFGYTTGLTAIDYYLSDSITAPVSAQSIFSERIWHLSGPSFVYRPPVNMPAPNDLPFLRNGYMTFGCFSRAIRINRHVIKIWAAVLNAVPDSHLVINSSDFLDRRICDEMAARFVEHGVEHHRLHIGCDSPPWNVMHQVDIGLDCFPHNSGTTLYEMLYMGIPFVTLADRPPVGRIGASLLTWMGLSELIATSEVEYAEKLVILAHKPDELVSLRQQLRDTMRSSPVMDEIGFCRTVEQAFKQMWQQYCATEEK